MNLMSLSALLLLLTWFQLDHILSGSEQWLEVVIMNDEKKENSRVILPVWFSQLSPFREANNWKASGQIVNTLVPYFTLWYLMIRSIHLGFSYFYTFLLIIPAAAFLVRIFIMFHDCVHGSFFSSKKLNSFFGYFLGLLVFTAFEDWRFSHLRHHASFANLDARGMGDVWTLTVEEYNSSSLIIRWKYRFFRSSVALIGFGAVFVFMLSNRFPHKRVKKNVRMSVLFTNLLIVLVTLIAHQIMGWKTFLLIQIPVLWLAGAAGIWLFYVQHQFEGVYWARKVNWNRWKAAFEGCSFYWLPPVLRWFSGSIGYHQVHHLSARIPNYFLKKCYDTIPEIQTEFPLTIRKSLNCLKLKLWDETGHRLVGFQ